MNIMTVFFFFFLSCSSYIIHSHFATMSHWYVYNLRYYDSNNNKNKLMNFFFFYLSIYYEWKIVNGEMITRILVFLLPPSNRIKTNTVSLYDKSHLADQRSNYHSWYPNHVSILAQYKFQFVPINFSRFSLSFVFPLFTLLVIHSVKRNVESRS